MISKQQHSMMSSMPIPPFNMGMHYPQTSQTINLEESNKGFSDEVKKYFESNTKMNPYYFMNGQYGSQMYPPMSSYLNPSMSSGIGLPYGMPVQMPNPYMNFPSAPSSNFIQNQLKNVPRPSGLPYGLNSYGSTPGMPSMYSSQFMRPYSGSSNIPPSMMGGFGSSSNPYSHLMGMDKQDIISKNIDLLSQPSQISQIDKNYSNISNNRQDLTSSRSERDKSTTKESKQSLPPTKIGLGSHQNGNSNKNEERTSKPESQFLPRKLPFNDTKKLVEPNSELKNCACRGYFEYKAVFTCSSCKNKFHFRCLSIQQKPQDFSLSEICCAHCKMRSMDPLNKVQTALGEFYLMNLFEKPFQTIMNFKPFEPKCRDKNNTKYEIELRCIRSGEHMKSLEITWPDECQIKINNEKIVDIPALQSNSSLKKRKDYSVFITSNIFSKTPYINPDVPNVLQKIKLSLELKTLTQQQANAKRIRNQYTFALGVYLVEKLTTDELYNNVMNVEKIQDKDFIKNLMKTSQNEVEIDKITVRLIDPFSWDMIKTPVRGHKCTHAQCFDLKTFISLMLSAKNRTWKCPLCSKDSRKFMFDYEQSQLLKKAEDINPAPKQVQIYKDGKISFKVEKDSDDQEDPVSSTTKTKTKKITKQKKQEVSKEN